MALDKEEIKKNKYSIVSGLLSTFILFLIFHFGNILGLTDNSKETSSKIIVVFLYITLLVGTLFVNLRTSQSKTDPQKRYSIFKGWVKLFAVFILLLATYGLYKFFTKSSSQIIPQYIIKIINPTDTTQTVSEIVDLSITKPVTPFQDRQIDYQRGQLSQNNIVQKIIIAKRDTALASVNFTTTKQLFDLYQSGQFEMTIILKTENGKFSTINLPFTQKTLERRYSECYLH